MEVLLPFIITSFLMQFIAFGFTKHRFLRWIPTIVLELLFLIGMIRHWIDPPSFDILGWEIYLWLMGSIFLGGVLAWGAYLLYSRKER